VKTNIGKPRVWVNLYEEDGLVANVYDEPYSAEALAVARTVATKLLESELLPSDLSIVVEVFDGLYSFTTSIREEVRS
jgi:hypothetical protein